MGGSGKRRVIKICNKLRIHEVLDDVQKKEVLRFPDVSSTPKFSELKLLESVYSREEGLKFYKANTRSRSFKPSRITTDIIDKYMEKTIPDRLQYRPLRKDLDREQAARSFWSMISSELQWTWPKENNARVIATGSMLSESPLLKKIVKDLGAEVLPSMETWQSTFPLQIDPQFTLEYSSLDDLIKYLRKKECQNVISYTFFDNAFDLN